MNAPLPTARFRMLAAVGAPTSVDADHGRIIGASALQLMKPKGWPLAVDQKTLDLVAALGNAAGGKGLKVRFAHPGDADGLGTLVGHATNFRVAGDKVLCDIQLAESAKFSPRGNLHVYLMKLAGESPEDFGLSLQFSYARAWSTPAGEVIAKDRPANATNDLPLVRPTALAAVDFVDEPAANADGLFAAGNLPDEPPANPGPTMTTMKIPADRLAILKAEFSAHAALILDRALEGDDEAQLRARISDAKFAAVATERDEFKAKLEKASGDHTAALKAEQDAHAATKAEFAALKTKHDGLLGLAKGGAGDPGAATTKATADDIDAAWAALPEADRKDYFDDKEAFREATNLKKADRARAGAKG